MATFKQQGRLNLADGSHQGLGQNPTLEGTFLNGKVVGNRPLHLKECSAAGQIIPGGETYQFFPGETISGINVTASPAPSANGIGNGGNHGHGNH